ncbi:MAG: RNase adapter RapZ [Leptospirillia bacterium]
MKGGSPKAHTNRPIHFLVITGTSGAGKSHALNYLEDVGYFCIDNLPLSLATKLAELCERSGQDIHRIALVADVRERVFLEEEGSSFIAELRRRGHTVEVLFFDADDAVLIRRFSETRRPHPLSPDGNVAEGLALERTLLKPLSNIADLKVDTSTFSVHDLRDYVQRRYGGDAGAKSFTVSLVAFGYKYGIPLETDLLFDVRFLDNPHFQPDLRPLTGENDRVKDYVLADKRTLPFLNKAAELLDMTLPEYEREGRSYLTVGIGCTGGKHRSVVAARWLAEHLAASGRRVEVRLRDTPTGSQA